ncbi:MAG: DciA family protein [Candidatus Moranbacteria bacterium]|jgi:hypothetical protein|nr:DciA family protein [Candidatus Moranbacteria bacterium]MDX9855583.1 DciA family protein [Candidatus Moranbacteria bacterium]
MRSLNKILKNKKILNSKKKDLDSETVFFLFNKIIEVKYGEIGRINIRTSFYKEGSIFLEIKNSNWANEIWMNKKSLIMEINKKIGGDDIKEIKIRN